VNYIAITISKRHSGAIGGTLRRSVNVHPSNTELCRTETLCPWAHPSFVINFLQASSVHWPVLL